MRGGVVRRPASGCCCRAAAAAGRRSRPGPGAAGRRSGRLSTRWRVVGLPQQKPPPTRYAAVSVDGRVALQVDAEASYGPGARGRRASGAAHAVVAWRMEQPNPAADLRTKRGDDTAARVCLSFALPLEQVPFLERQLLRVARAAQRRSPAGGHAVLGLGTDETPAQPDRQPLQPPRALPGAARAADGTGRWLDERRDVAADFRRPSATRAPTAAAGGGDRRPPTPTTPGPGRALTSPA
jgi:hypothetical protein